MSSLISSLQDFIISLPASIIIHTCYQCGIICLPPCQESSNDSLKLQATRLCSTLLLQKKIITPFFSWSQWSSNTNIILQFYWFYVSIVFPNDHYFILNDTIIINAHCIFLLVVINVFLSSEVSLFMSAKDRGLNIMFITYSCP